MQYLAIEIQDRISPHLQRILARMRDTRPVMAAIGGEIERTVRRHFEMRDDEPNAKGWPKRHFWAREGRRNTAVTQVTASEAWRQL